MNLQQEKSAMELELSSGASMEDLPEGTLLHILSFLPTPVGVKTIAVSPAWRNLFPSVPVLDFNLFDYRRCLPDKIDYDHRLRFAEFIRQTILHRHPGAALRKFKVIFCYWDEESIRLYVDSWIRYALSSKAEELSLQFSYNDSEEYPWLPDDILSYDYVDEDEEGDNSLKATCYVLKLSDLINSSVKVLKLSGGDLLLPSNASVKIDSIREIHLQQIPRTDGEIAHLIASCVNLEVLSLVDIPGLQNLKIVSEKLKHFKLSGFGGYDIEESSVEIRAPSLESINFYFVFAGKYKLKDTPSLVAANVDFLYRNWVEFVCWSNVVRFLIGVKRLTIQNMWSWFLEPQGCHYASPQNMGRDRLGEIKVADDVFAFHNLKYLELLTDYLREDILSLEVLLKKCPQLETMVLVYCYPSRFMSHLAKDIPGKSIALHMPSLRLVKMKEYHGTEDELYLVSLLKKHGTVLERIVAYPAKEEDGPPFVLWLSA